MIKTIFTLIIVYIKTLLLLQVGRQAVRSQYISSVTHGNMSLSLRKPTLVRMRSSGMLMNRDRDQMMIITMITLLFLYTREDSGRQMAINRNRVKLLVQRIYWLSQTMCLSLLFRVNSICQIIFSTKVNLAKVMFFLHWVRVLMLKSDYN